MNLGFGFEGHRRTCFLHGSSAASQGMKHHTSSGYEPNVEELAGAFDDGFRLSNNVSPAFRIQGSALAQDLEV